jgi:hypothetical protein
VTPKKQPDGSEFLGFLGVGLDNKDEHQRLTHSKNFFLIGGSEETHERMQDTAIRFDEGLERKGKDLREATLEEIMELFRRSCE